MWMTVNWCRWSTLNQFLTLKVPCGFFMELNLCLQSVFLIKTDCFPFVSFLIKHLKSCIVYIQSAVFFFFFFTAFVGEGILARCCHQMSIGRIALNQLHSVHHVTHVLDDTWDSPDDPPDWKRVKKPLLHSATSGEKLHRVPLTHHHQKSWCPSN